MTKKTNQAPKLNKLTSIQSRILGKRFKLDNDPEIYEVMGLKGRTKQVVLQVPSTERIRIMSEDEFLELASEIKS
jgi:hypothetical protein